MCQECRRRLYETAIQGGGEISYARKPKAPNEDIATRVCSCLCGCLTTRIEEQFWCEAPDRPGQYLCRPCYGRWKTSTVLCGDCWTQTRDYVVAHDVGPDVFVSVSISSQ